MRGNSYANRNTAREKKEAKYERDSAGEAREVLSTPHQGLERAIYSLLEEIDRPIRRGGRCGAIVAFCVYEAERASQFFRLRCTHSESPIFSMSPPSNKNKDTSHSRHRSHKGCWTCKRKRIQCDETRPGCRRCAERGLTCEGYEIRLRWGAGIASRGRFSGADKPVQESIPPPSKRRWNLRAKGERGGKDEQGQPVLLLRQTSSDGKRSLLA